MYITFKKELKLQSLGEWNKHDDILNFLVWLHIQERKIMINRMSDYNNIWIDNVRISILVRYHDVILDALFLWHEKLVGSVLYRTSLKETMIYNVRYSNFHVCLILRKCLIGLHLTVDF